MSNVFVVPCPGCGHPLSTKAAGVLECLTCQRAYHARMGHLVAVDERSPVGRAERGAGLPLPESS